jgi:cytochrome c-type biogenesis protein CcmI
VAFYIAAVLIIAGVALFVAAPLSGGLRGRETKVRQEIELDHWAHERALAVQGLRELEFDREMGKLSNTDYESLRASLEGRGLQAMTAVEKFKEQERAANLAAVTALPKLREAAAIAAEIAAMSRPQAAIPIASGMSQIPPPVAAPRGATAEIGGARRIRFCPQCGMRAPLAGNFCGECGTPLSGERAATRAS